METVTLDELDRALVHALHIDGRAPFNRIAIALEVSESTVARRYRRLRTAGVLRVTASVNLGPLGYVPWTIRLRCTPDASGAIATALARRNDTFWVHLLSGGTEISCGTQTLRGGEGGEGLLLQKLSRTSRVNSVTAHSLLQSFTDPGSWSGFACLGEEQQRLLRPRPPAPDERRTALDEGDRALLELLSLDGRTGHAELAADTGLSESTVRRRLERLRHLGVLSFQVDLPMAALGYHAEARLWLSVKPSALVSVARTLAGHREVSFVAITTGPTNVMASVVCRDTGDLYRYLTERVAALDEVHTVETATVDRTVKRTGTLLPFGA
ncbi:Lrp/AsnC family transcriptional regulator [Streptomyces orinoci]|uniref:Lrp/AsnC family transcriptional regulator n=1 Tax=Streptomyces orinoci TaxID=67339 RepID=A0ABV3JVL8_STRON|nr:Lrp/AsnC family transcriptional regulator [Streptomyces orinoci]